MSSSIDGQFHNHVARRIAEIGIGFSGASVYFTNLGDDVTDGPTDGKSGGIAYQVDSEGARRRISTIATLNDVNYIKGAPIWRREYDLGFYGRIALPTNSSVRAFFGLTSLTPDNQVASDSPVGHYAGIKKELANSNFEFTSCDGSSTKDTSAIAADTSVHDFFMWLKKTAGGNCVLFQIDNNPRTIHLTNLPANTQTLSFVCVVKALTGVIKSIDVAKIHIDAAI
ncbi:MAG: hypothetical protein HZC29_09135 [Thaumarchaeota archaeon]|nr:hypothetical protein [Nitrososphaerota archaeon]